MTIPNIGREMVAGGLGIGVVGAIYLSFGVLRSPVGIASELLGQFDADRLHSKEKHVSLVAAQELARATLSGRFGLACLVVSGTLQVLGLVTPSAPTRALWPLASALIAALLGAVVGRRYIRRHHAAFMTAVWGSSTVTAVTALEPLRLNALRANRWRDGWLLRSMQRWFTAV